MYDHIGEIVRVLNEAEFRDARVEVLVDCPERVKVEIPHQGDDRRFAIDRSAESPQTTYRVLELPSYRIGPHCLGEFATVADAAGAIITELTTQPCDVCGRRLPIIDLGKAACEHMVCSECFTEDKRGLIVCDECLKNGYWYMNNGYLYPTPPEAIYCPPPRTAD